VTSTTADPNAAPNNAASATVQIANTPPAITLVGAADMSVECATSFSDPGATAADSCQGPVPVVVSGAVAVDRLGAYLLSYDATDAAGGHAATVTRNVQVVDTTAPAITVIGANPVTLECPAPFSDPGATAADTCAGPLAVTATGTVNSRAPGSYLVGYTASDPSGNSTTAARTVIVRDTGAPSLDLVDLTILNQGSKITVEDGILTIDGQSTPLPSGTITFKGHVISSDGTTLVVDGQPFPLDGKTIVLLSPQHDYQAFAVADLLAGGSDTCDATVGLGGAVIAQASSDEPQDAPGGRDGNTVNDVVIAPDCRSVQLRVERDSGGNGRVYNVRLKVRDASGNASVTNARVMVPVNPNPATAVDDGPSYTITSSCP
jgi:hypothetical protein